MTSSDREGHRGVGSDGSGGALDPRERRLREALADWDPGRDLRAPAGFTARVMARVRQDGGPPRWEDLWGRQAPRAARWAAAGALVAGILAGAGGVLAIASRAHPVAPAAAVIDRSAGRPDLVSAGADRVGTPPVPAAPAAGPVGSGASSAPARDPRKVDPPAGPDASGAGPRSGDGVDATGDLGHEALAEAALADLDWAGSGFGGGFGEDYFRALDPEAPDVATPPAAPEDAL